MPESKSSPGPDDVPPFIPPLIDAINRFATTVPEYLVRIADAAVDASAVSSRSGRMPEITRFLNIAAALQQAVKQPEAAPAPEPKGAPEQEANDDVLDAAYGLFAWVKGDPCKDPAKYKDLAMRLWKDNL